MGVSVILGSAVVSPWENEVGKVGGRSRGHTRFLSFDVNN